MHISGLFFCPQRQTTLLGYKEYKNYLGKMLVTQGNSSVGIFFFFFLFLKGRHNNSSLPGRPVVQGF